MTADLSGTGTLDGRVAAPAGGDSVGRTTEARGAYAAALRHPAEDSWSWAARESAVLREAEASEARRALLLRSVEAFAAVAAALGAAGGPSYFAPLLARLEAASRSDDGLGGYDEVALLGVAYLSQVVADLAAALADLGEGVAEVRGKVLGHEEARRAEWRVQKARRRAAAKAEAAGARAGAGAGRGEEAAG